MYAYRVAVKKKDGEIIDLPIVTTKEPSMTEALNECKGYGSAMKDEVVSVTLATLGGAGDLVSDITGEYFNIKELADASARLLDCSDTPSERQTMQVIQLSSIIQQKANKVMELLNVLDKLDE